MKIELVVVGTSMGGLNALETILTGLSRDFALPIAVVQHRGVMSTDRLSAILRRHTHLHVHETQDKEPIAASTLYLAPPDYHLMVEKGWFALSTEAPVLYARPAIDVLFESAADAYAERVLAVVLTGASRDGALGGARVKARGGRVLVQSPATAESPAMPEAAIESAQPDWILPLAEIGPFLNQLNCKAS